MLLVITHLTNQFKQHVFLQSPPATLITLDCRAVVAAAAGVVLVVFAVVTGTGSAAITSGAERRQMLSFEKENQ